MSCPSFVFIFALSLIPALSAAESPIIPDNNSCYPTQGNFSRFVSKLTGKTSAKYMQPLADRGELDAFGRKRFADYPVTSESKRLDNDVFRTTVKVTPEVRRRVHQDFQRILDFYQKNGKEGVNPKDLQNFQKWWARNEAILLKDADIEMIQTKGISQALRLYRNKDPELVQKVLEAVKSGDPQHLVLQGLKEKDPQLYTFVQYAMKNEDITIKSFIDDQIEGYVVGSKGLAKVKGGLEKTLDRASDNSLVSGTAWVAKKMAKGLAMGIGASIFLGPWLDIFKGLLHEDTDPMVLYANQVGAKLGGDSGRAIQFALIDFDNWISGVKKVNEAIESDLKLLDSTEIHYVKPVQASRSQKGPDLEREAFDLQLKLKKLKIQPLRDGRALAKDNVVFPVLFHANALGVSRLHMEEARTKILDYKIKLEEDNKTHLLSAGTRKLIEQEIEQQEHRRRLAEEEIHSILSAWEILKSMYPENMPESYSKKERDSLSYIKVFYTEYWEKGMNLDQYRKDFKVNLRKFLEDVQKQNALLEAEGRKAHDFQTAYLSEFGPTHKP